MLPDIPFVRSREDLLPYEDAAAERLFSGIPNFYSTRNDQTVRGSLLRAVAIELAKLDYAYAYDLVNKDPRYLTPPDSKRRWGKQLGISGRYPTDEQSVQDFKDMVVQLLPAYMNGARLNTLNDITFAYTGKAIPAVEMFKMIGDVFPASVRNTVSVTVDVSSILSSLTTELESVGNDLYTALDLVKPAHVGLDFALLFSEADHPENNIGDTPAFIYRGVETPLPVPFILSPTSRIPGQLAAYGERVGSVFALSLNSSAWSALPTTFQSEYYLDGATYKLSLASYDDVALTNGDGISASDYASLTPQEQSSYTLGSDGNYYDFTGVISKVQSPLSPQKATTWEIKSDSFKILEVG